MEDKKLNHQLILIIVITLVLAAVAAVLYLGRSKDTPTDEPGLTEQLKDVTSDSSDKDQGKTPDKDTGTSTDSQDKTTDDLDKDTDTDENEGIDADIQDGQDTETTSKVSRPYCDKDTTPKASQKRYQGYITVSAVDKDGCALIDNDENRKYIREQTMRVYNAAVINSGSFTYENPMAGGAIKADEITVRNKNGNIIGWSQIVLYGDAINSGRYAYSRSGTWEYIGN